VGTLFCEIGLSVSKIATNWNTYYYLAKRLDGSRCHLARR